MILIFTLDDNNATQFCGKRQSTDSEVATHILDFANNAPIYMKEKSKSFFNTAIRSCSQFVFVDNFNDVPEDAVCFIEEVVSDEILNKVDLMLVYRWNRVYPSVVKDRLNLDDYTKHFIESFKGSSHNQITTELYMRKG